MHRLYSLSLLDEFNYKDEVNTLSHATKFLTMAAVICGHTNTKYSMAFHVRSWHE